MEGPQIRKELFDLALCVETLLHLINKGSPLNSAEKEFMVRLADTFRDGGHVARPAVVPLRETGKPVDSVGCRGNQTSESGWDQHG